LLTACLHRVLAQVDVTFSNSMIEAFWRSLKHQWLYLNSLDSIERLRILVEFYVEQHNTQMPHAAFSGQMPDEMYFGAAAGLPASSEPEAFGVSPVQLQPRRNHQGIQPAPICLLTLHS